MNERELKAFDFAQESVKQLLALATSIIALTITFAKDFVQGTTHDLRLIAIWSWGLYLASVVFGLWALLALTGTLAPVNVTDSATEGEPGSTSGASPWDSNVRIPAVLQIVAFVVGLILTVVFGAMAI